MWSDRGMRALAAVLLLAAPTLVALPPARGDDPAWVTTDHARYESGQSVIIRFRNPLDVNVTLPMRPSWYVTDETGQVVVYAPAALQEGEVVAPGGMRNYTYRLITQDREPLPPGTYRARVSVLVPDGNGGSRAIEPEATFLACTQPRALPLGAVDRAQLALRC